MCASGAVGCLGMARSDTCGVEHGGDRSESVVGFEASPLVPSEHGGSVDEQDLLNVGVVGGGVEELLECSGQEVERVAALRRACCRGEIGLDLMEDGEEQVLLVGEVVVKRASC